MSVNNSPLRKYFGQNYGRKEDDLEVRANAENQFVDYQGQLLLKNQYDALTAVAGQYGKMPEELRDVEIESGLVRKLDLNHMPIKTSDGTLIIPKELTSLQQLNCQDNQLQFLLLPKELTSLQVLCCSYNQLQSLVLPKELTLLKEFYCGNNCLQTLILPKELTSLQVLYCGTNRLQSLVLPKELTSLQGLYCNDNQLLSFVLPKEFTSLQHLGCVRNQLRSLMLPIELKALKTVFCGGNPSLPREVISELRSRGVEVHE